MPGEPEGSWATMDLGSLLELLQSTTERLRKAHETVAMDEAAYHRKYWVHWQELPGELSIAAMTRECERVARSLNEEWIISKSLLAGLTAKQHALIAALGSRADA